MATTIQSGRSSSPLLTADVASRAEVYGGRSISFDGSTDYLTISEDVLANKSQGTISFWTKTSGTGNQAILGYHRDQWSIRFNKTTMFLGIGGTTVTASSSLDNSAWGFHTITFNSGTAKFYKDGELYHTATSYGSSFPSNSNGIFIGKRNHPSAYYYNGSISDVKVHSSALTEAEVQSQYLKPESIPSPSTLVAWYPMSEANPESPQSIVYDHSEKGKLGSDLVTNGDMSNLADAGSNGYAFRPSSGWTFKHSSNSGGTSTQFSQSDNGALRIFSNRDGIDYYTVGANVLVSTGVLYKLTFDAKTNDESKTNLGVRYSNGNNMAYGNNGLDVGATLTTSFQTFTYYFVPDAHSNGGRAVHFGRHHNTSVGHTTSVDATLDNVSIKEVLMGNHATTNFFGNMADLINESNDSEIWDATNNRFSFTIAGWSGYDDATSLVDDTDWVKTTNIDRAKRKSDADHAFLRKSSGTYEFISHPLTLENGKTYNVSGVYSSSSASSINVEVGASAPSSNSDYTHWATQSLTSSGGTIDLNFIAQATTGHLVIELSGGANENAFLEHIAVREVGISSSGFDTAQNEPVIPQIPLVKYNEKMLFGGSNSTTQNDRVENFNDACISGDFTISFWYLQSASHGWTLLLYHSYNYALYGKSNGTFQLRLGDSTYIDFSYTHQLNTLRHFTFTRSSGTIKLYVNGIEQSDTETHSGDFKFNKIGHTSYSLRGLIDDLSMYNCSMSIAQVQELFNDGVALDATTHSKSGNLLSYHRNDGVTTWQDRRAWSYLNFDGSGDYISTNADSTLADATYTFWARSTQTGANKGVFGHGGQDRGAFHFNFSSDRPLLYMGANRFRYWNDNSAQDDGAWHHWAVVLDADDMTGCKLYVDGVEQTVSQTTNSGVYKAYTTGLNIGRSDSSYVFEGSMAQFAIYSDLKEQTFIDAEFNKGINSDWSSNSDLLGYWKLDNATTVTDLSSNSNNGTVTEATLNTGNDGDVQGTPDLITIREGLNSGKDGLGFPLKNPSSNVLRLNGSSEYVKANFTNTTYSVYTISCWIKANSLSNYIRIIQVDSSNERYLGLHGDGKVLSSYYSGSWSEKYTTATLSTDRWYYLTLVDDDTQTKIYIDNGSPETLANSIQITNPYLYIGTHEGSGNFFDGLVDEVKFYNRELSATEILKNYKHGKGKHKND